MQIGANLTARELANRCKFLDSSLYDEQTGAPTCKLHADAAVCLCCENRHRTTTRVRVQPHRRPFPSSSTKVGSSIHRVRPASGFLLVAQSKATRHAASSQNSGVIPPRRSRLGTNDLGRIYSFRQSRDSFQGQYAVN